MVPTWSSEPNFDLPGASPYAASSDAPVTHRLPHRWLWTALGGHDLVSGFRNTLWSTAPAFWSSPQQPSGLLQVAAPQP
jgi:hypothetical protein